MNVGQTFKEENAPLIKKIPHAREEISTIFLIGLAILTIFLAFRHILTPIYMLLILATHILMRKIPIHYCISIEILKEPFYYRCLSSPFPISSPGLQMVLIRMQFLLPKFA